MDWNDLRDFLAISRHRTLSAAADALGVQQSTMGRRLKALEARVGAKLLHRTPAGFVLTATGEAILDNVERIESEARAVERAISGKDIRLEGTVRLATIEDLTVDVLTPILAQFHADYPGITLELITDSRKRSLAVGEVDVALRLSQFTESELVVRKVADFAFAAYASPAYIAHEECLILRAPRRVIACCFRPRSSAAHRRQNGLLHLPNRRALPCARIVFTCSLPPPKPVWALPVCRASSAMRRRFSDSVPRRRRRCTNCGWACIGTFAMRRGFVPSPNSLPPD